MSGMIGVIPLFDEHKDSLWMLPGYLEGIQKAGGVPIVLPLTASEEQIQKVYDVCDGFLFTGGHDVNPALYNEEKMERCGTINQERDNLETQIFQMAFCDDKPILGICRGLQLINVLLGGTLYQDLDTQFPSELEHVMRPPYNRSVHAVHIEENTPLFALTGANQLGVNSYHHQGIKELADELDAMAVAADGLIEAVYCKSKKFVWGVQWHPEFNFKIEPTSMMLFETFVQSTRSYNLVKGTVS